MKAYLTIIIVFFSLSTFSQETKCECYSKSGVKEKTGIGGWTSIIGTNSEGEQLQYHFYAAYFPPQELCIPRDNFWWQDVNAAILKAIKSHPIYKSSQIALATDDPDATPKATNIAGQAFITQEKVYEIERLPGTIVSVDAYIQEHFASKLSLCGDINNKIDFNSPKEKNEEKALNNQGSYDTPVSKNNQSKNAQDFIGSQNEQFAKQQALNQQLANDLTQTFNQISNSWAEERDFQSKISSLTNIKSVNASSIVNEARSKAQQINNEYATRKQDALNQGVSATQNLVNSAQNEEQAIAGGILGAGLTALSQSNLEKERKKAQEKLENEKQQILNKLSQKIIDKFEPIKIQHKQAAIYALKKENEDYHLAQYEYAKCMTENAFKIVVDDYSCEKPQNSKPATKTKKPISGQDYFNAYKRKQKNSFELVRDKAPYFLELAIDAEPNKAEWLYEKTLVQGLDIYERASILKRVVAIDKSGQYKNDFDDVLKTIAELKLKEQQIINITLSKHKDYNWTEHDNLMRVYIDYQYEFAKPRHIVINKNGTKVLDFGNKYDFNNDNFRESEISKQYNNGRLRFRQSLNGTNLYGFLNTKGEIQTTPTYLNATHFSEGLSAVQDYTNQKWGFIDEFGKIVIDFKYAEAKAFSQGLAFVKKIKREKEGKYINPVTRQEVKVYVTEAVYINNKEDIIIEGSFDTGESFKNGYARVTRYTRNDSFMGGGNDKTYYIDKEGNEASEEESNLVDAFNSNNGYSTIKDGNYYAIVDSNGKITSKLKFHNKPIFNEGIAVVSTSTAWRAVFGTYTKYGYIDYTGKTIAKIKYTKAQPFENGKALVELNDEVFYIDKNGSRIIEDKDSNTEIEELSNIESVEDLEKILKEKYDEVTQSGNGFRIKKDERYGFINNDGKTTIPVDYKTLGLFYNGLAVFNDKSNGTFKKYGYINENGEIIVSEKYQECGNFSEGIAVVAKVSVLGRKVGYIDTNGNKITPLKYYTGTPFENGKAQVNDGNYFKPNIYYIDKEGNKISN
ncbi:WG repeat-containing protein [Polaribacter atrinae]|uniref:WG repeat-containing protein n=1 Tax=Polaribacter atrinae TaxID=1333662 RepID=A0A176T0Z6_9FLAO|nr:WG repeat-containing protein [Polaribacter atrinae]OAD41341.1 hypothetical protein LPB303_15520 [Polaribacter atrinae]